MVCTVARLEPFHYANFSGTVPRRRDRSIKKQCVDSMWQKFKSEEYWGGTMLPTSSNCARGASQKILHMCCLHLLARTIKEGLKICHPPSLLGGPVVKPRKPKSKWVCQKQRVLLREREYFESRSPLKF